MPAKLTKEIVNQRLEGRGIRLVGHYDSAMKKTLFQCPEGHEWEARPDNVMNDRGCPHCAGLAPLSKEIVNDRIADRGISLIGDYTTARTKALFRCPEGHEWMAAPSDVMKGNGCLTCAGKAPLSKEIVNERLASRGIVLIGKYKNNSTKALFRCPEGHEWMAKPNNIMNGKGCPSCAKYGFDRGESAILYYLRFETNFGPLWKIGITNRSVKDRFTLEKTRFKIVKQWEYSDGTEALAREAEILSTFKQHKYNGQPILSNGNSELFNIDILCLEETTNVHPRQMGNHKIQG